MGKQKFLLTKPPLPGTLKVQSQRLWFFVPGARQSGGREVAGNGRKCRDVTGMKFHSPDQANQRARMHPPTLQKQRMEGRLRRALPVIGGPASIARLSGSLS